MLMASQYRQIHGPRTRVDGRGRPPAKRRLATGAARNETKNAGTEVQHRRKTNGIVPSRLLSGHVQPTTPTAAHGAVRALGVHGWQREAIDALLDGSSQVLSSGRANRRGSPFATSCRPSSRGTRWSSSAHPLMEDPVRAFLWRGGIPATFIPRTSIRRAQEGHSRASSAPSRSCTSPPSASAFRGFSELMGNIELSLPRSTKHIASSSGGTTFVPTICA